jgi:alpha-amylase
MPQPERRNPSRALLGFLVLLFLGTAPLAAQQFMMQGWYWEFPKSVSSPTNFAVTVNNQVDALESAGFTDLWLPPISKGTGGGFSVGYDVQDLFDLGEFGSGATGFGTRAELDALLGSLDNANIRAVADVVYNHRDGGRWERNPGVENWIENFSFSQAANNNTPYPSDRWRCALPLGGTTGNEAGDYYFKISSASQHPNFHNAGYTLYMWTKRKGFQGLPDQVEAEPNGGGDCGQPFNTIEVGGRLQASVDASGCTADEFYLALQPGDYFAFGDTLYIELRNTGGYSDHRIYGIWSTDRAEDIQAELEIQTATDYTAMPSGRGDMDWRNFKPNGNPTTLAGDLDFPWFFTDYDNSVQSTRDTLMAYTRWLWEDVGIRGFRLDAVKHFPANFLGSIMDEMHTLGYDPPIIVGEFFDFNPSVLNTWVNFVEGSMSGPAQAAQNVRAFDFALRGALKSASDAFGYDVRNVFQSGMVDGDGGSPFSAVTFVNNHDFRNPGEPVQNDPQLGYAYILTNNQVGVPCVYYPDFFGAARPNAPTVNLEDEIAELMQVHEDFIVGSTTVDYLNRFGTPYANNYIEGQPSSTLFYQLGNNPAGKSIVVAINYSGGPLRMDHNINTGIGVNSGDTMWAIAGSANNGFSVVSGASMYVDLPPRSYAVFVNCNRPSRPKMPTDVVACPSDPYAPLSVLDEGLQYDWYDAPNGGNLVQENSASFATTTAGTYYVETVGACGSSERVAVTLSESIAACNCSEPANVADGAIFPTAVTLFWDEVADALGYQVRGREVGTPSWRSFKTTNVINSVNVLEPGTTYEWQVRSFCGGTTLSPFTASRTFTTPGLKLAASGEDAFRLWPNPTKDRVQLQGSVVSAQAQLMVFDALGQVRYSDNLQQGPFSRGLDVSSWPAGLYQVVVMDGGKRSVRSLSVSGN